MFDSVSQKKAPCRAVTWSGGVGDELSQVIRLHPF